MLRNRIQILVDDQTLDVLKRLSQERNISVGKLVRAVVKKEYVAKDPYEARKKALEETLRIRPAVSKIPIDYKVLINEGRKY